MKKDQLVGARLPVTLVKELEQIEELEQSDRSTIVRKLLSNAVREWKLDHFARAYGVGQITLARAAREAGVTLWQMQAYLHANKIAAHLIDRHVLPETGAIPAPKNSFKSILEAAMHAQAMERANTKGIHSVYEAALAEKDYPAQVLMHWFINEQVEEEQWSSEMVERVQAATCAGGASDLDRHIERYLSDKVFGEEAEK